MNSKVTGMDGEVTYPKSVQENNFTWTPVINASDISVVHVGLY
jgi:hypothetical protein